MKKKIDQIVEKVTTNFRTFGGGYVTPGNPISSALANHPASFAAGVDVREVVEFILKQNSAIQRKRK
jgi:hypothetical protein